MGVHTHELAVVHKRQEVVQLDILVVEQLHSQEEDHILHPEGHNRRLEGHTHYHVEDALVIEDFSSHHQDDLLPCWVEGHIQVGDALQMDCSDSCLDQHNLSYHHAHFRIHPHDRSRFVTVLHRAIAQSF